MKPVLKGLFFVGAFGASTTLAERRENRHFAHLDQKDLPMEEVLLLRDEVTDYPMTDKRFQGLYSLYDQDSPKTNNRQVAKAM